MLALAIQQTKIVQSPCVLSRPSCLALKLRRGSLDGNGGRVRERRRPNCYVCLEHALSEIRRLFLLGRTFSIRDVPAPPARAGFCGLIHAKASRFQHTTRTTLFCWAHLFYYVLEMSTMTPFRDLPARAKAVLPPWELTQDKEEVQYKLTSCRGVTQNSFHEVSTCSIEVHLLLLRTPLLTVALQLCR